MKNLLFLLTLVSVMFIGCDGKDRVHLSNTEVLKEHKLLDSFSESVVYFPKEYNEITIDTTLSNGFRIKIKSLTDLENAQLIDFESDGIHNKHYFRELINIIEVYKNEKIIFKQTLTNAFLNKLNSNYIIDKNYIKNIPIIDDFNSLKENKAIINLSHCIPRTVNCPDYRLTINTNGDHKLKEIN
ncbi:hypothetical protein [Lacinutrix sp.]|uniref:hypothetical protein n=1 Tax=Lacinutrix sp. TaxID=1937692 RepID=UPI0025C5A8A8|nr:hypothetical protein [Lacinutrix sp.]